MKFSFIHAEKAMFPVSALCRVLGVSRQGYYAWAARPTSLRDKANRALAVDVARVFRASRGTYGVPRIQAALRHEGVRVGKRRLERTMRQLELKARRPRRFRRTTVRNEDHAVASNTLGRAFQAERPDEKWVTDITYIATVEGWSYLAVVIDLFSRRVVGWALDTDISTQLPLAALEMACTHRQPPPGLLHHSDRGCQYTSRKYREALSRSGIAVSMSRKGNCWDNAVAESFFATLKTELIRGRKWRGYDELNSALFDYIEIFYNRQRIHSTNCYKTPVQAEENYNAANAA